MSKAVPTGICLALAGFISVSAVFGQTSPQPVDTSTAAADLQAAADSNSLSKKSPSIKRPRIGLALGGGGSRGAGHVGVLKVLKEENIPIDIIAGTSIGSVVGGFYAAGKPIDEIGQIFVKNTFTKEFTPMPALRIATEPAELMLRLFGYKPYDGLYRGWKFRGFVNKALTKLNIEQLGIPYAAVVTDVVTGKSCRLTMGADFVIAIDIDEKLKDTPLDHFRGLGSMARQALKIQLAAFDSANDDRADMYIHPDTTGINLVSFKKGDGKAGIDAGIAAARAAMPELKKKLAALGIETVAQK
jgi:predicted acylesterase/phospholipase RssA